MNWKIDFGDRPPHKWFAWYPVLWRYESYRDCHRCGKKEFLPFE